MSTISKASTANERNPSFEEGWDMFKKYQGIPFLGQNSWIGLMTFFLVLSVSILLFFRHSSEFLNPQGRVPQDFQVYLTAGERMSRGESPYVPSEVLPYKYAPGVLVVLKGLPKNPEAAWVVFKFLCCMAWAGAVFLGFRVKSRRDLGLLLLGILLSWKGLLEALDYGQIEFLLFFVSVLAAKKLERSPFVSGLLLGVLPAFKLPWAFMGLPFLIHSFRKGKSEGLRFSAGGVAGFIFLMGLTPWIAFSFEQTRTLFEAWLQLLGSQPKSLYLDDHNQSIWSTSARWMEIDPNLGWFFGFALGVICLLFLMRAAFDVWKRGTQTFEGDSSLVGLTPWFILLHLFNPLGWRWASLFLMGGAAAAFQNRFKYSKRAWTTGVGAVGILLLLQQNPVVQAFGLKHWTVLHHYGLITLYWLSVLVLV